MSEFKNGELVYWDNTSGYYIGRDPYNSGISYVINILNDAVGTIHTEVLSRRPPMSQRELNGKALFDDFARDDGDWVNNVPPRTKEVYMRLAEKLNYTAEEGE